MDFPNFKFAIREDLKNNKIFLPTRAEPKSSGWDVRSALDITIKPFQYAKIPLGIRGFCPDGWWYELKPRSSTFAKKHLHCLYGTIDSSYEGELIFACQFIPDSSIKESSEINIKFGEAVGQIIPVRRQEMMVSEVSNEEYNILCNNRQGARGSGGFGSTS